MKCRFPGPLAKLGKQKLGYQIWRRLGHFVYLVGVNLHKQV